MELTLAIASKYVSIIEITGFISQADFTNSAMSIKLKKLMGNHWSIVFLSISS